MQTITFTESSQGYKLRTPLTLSLPETQNAADKKLQQYIIDSLLGRMPSLLVLTFENASTINLAKHLIRHRTGSQATLYQYMYGIYRYSKWLNNSPDQLIKACQDEDGDPKPKALAQTSRLLDDFIANLQAENLAPGSVSNFVKALFRCNGLKLELNCSLPKRTMYRDRSPTPEELAILIDMTDIRLKVIISMLALGGFRNGTLTKLQYRHVKRDLEKGITPIHVHIEAEITKGKYHDYDTFIGQEAADYLRLYLQARRKGTEKIPPEIIQDNSPLIRNLECRTPVPITTQSVHKIVHDLYVKAGLLPQKPVGRCYELRVHSIRKFFRTQLAALGVQTDYIEYMMGHTISTYHDIQMKGIEYLRGIYGLSIKPKTRVSKIDALKEIIRAWGLNPEEILTRDALTKPNATVIGREKIEENQLHQLSIALKQQLLREMRDEQNGNRTNQ
ncbi:site-specific integrase [Candidatus Bathyarchaeota archaeon]|nr:site-specific integrase [Candidatus Bathyarchaeota archaeon]